MSTTTINDLPPEALAEILKWLNWHTRIGCESVSHKFRDVCEEMWTTTSTKTNKYPWIDLPNPMTFVVAVRSFGTKLPHLVFDDKEKTVRFFLKNDEALSEKLYDVLNLMLAKWAAQVKLLEIHQMCLDTKTMEFLSRCSCSMGKVKFVRCTFDKVPAVLFTKARLIFEGKEGATKMIDLI